MTGSSDAKSTPVWPSSHDMGNRTKAEWQNAEPCTYIPVLILLGTPAVQVKTEVTKLIVEPFWTTKSVDFLSSKATAACPLYLP